MIATTLSHSGKVRRHYTTIHFPDDYSLGPVFVRDRDEAAATLRTWRRTFAGWRGYVHRRLRHSNRSPEECRGILECVAMDTAALLVDIEASTWRRERCGQGTLRIADTEHVWLQLEDDRYGLTPLDRLQWNDLHSLTLRCAVAGDDLAHVAHLTGLNRLLIEHDTAITDDGLAHLSVLSGLRELALDAPHVSNDGLAALRYMPTLRSLHLNCPGTNGSALAHLFGLRRLEELSLHPGEPLSDDAVPHLRKLRSLRSLRATADTLSPAGEQALRDALPRCLFYLGHRPAADEDRPARTAAAPMRDLRYLDGEKAWYVW